jgi:hypothetical protein
MYSISSQMKNHVMKDKMYHLDNDYDDPEVPLHQKAVFSFH